MKTAQDFVQAAQEITRMAQAMRPDDGDPHHQARDLIRYYLRQAASGTRAIAEALALEELPK